MKVSELIGKRVVGLYEGETLATILRPALSSDFKKLKGFVIFDSDENELFISSACIFSAGDCVTVKNASKLSPYLEEGESVIGKNIFSTDGSMFGSIIDLEFNEDYKITAIQTDKERLEDYKLLVCAKDIIFSQDKNITCSSLKPKIKNYKNELLEGIKVKTQSLVVLENKMPLKFNGNTKLLIGRKVKNDIIGKNFELIAKKDQIINEKIIENAKTHNKLNYLFFNSVI